MFKKAFKISSNTSVGGKEKKNLKKDLSKLFDKESIDHFIDNNEKIICEKISGFNK